MSVLGAPWLGNGAAAVATTTEVDPSNAGYKSDSSTSYPSELLSNSGEDVLTVAVTDDREARSAGQVQARQRARAHHVDAGFNIDNSSDTAGLESLEQQVSILRVENNSLIGGQRALANLSGYQEQLLHLLCQASASASLRDGGTLHSGKLEIAESFMNQLFCDGHIPDEQWFR